MGVMGNLRCIGGLALLRCKVSPVDSERFQRRYLAAPKFPPSPTISLAVPPRCWVHGCVMGYDAL